MWTIEVLISSHKNNKESVARDPSARHKNTLLPTSFLSTNLTFRLFIKNISLLFFIKSFYHTLLTALRMYLKLPHIELLYLGKSMSVSFIVVPNKHLKSLLWDVRQVCDTMLQTKEL